METKGAFFALKIYCKDMYKVSIQFKIDNTSTFVWINKQTAPNKEIVELVNKVWEFYMERRIRFYIIHKGIKWQIFSLEK